MTRLWLVRHGPTHAKSMVGWSDLPADLSDLAALERLRDYLPDAPVVSSDLDRAVTTADALFRPNRLSHDPALREINFGDWELKTFAEIEDVDPHTIRAYWDTPGDVAPPNGESWHSVCRRVDDAIDGYLGQGRTELIVVAHFGVILTQLQRAKGISAYDTFAHKIDNLSVTQLTRRDSGWHLGVINHIP